LDFYLSTPPEIVIVGSRQDPATTALLSEVHRPFLPNKLVAVLDPEEDSTELDPGLVEEREMINGQPTAFVCEDYTCQMPVTDPQALAQQLVVTPEEPFMPGHGRGAPVVTPDC
jgi:uncharacterized protein YyaL (SSP411 family)